MKDTRSWVYAAVADWDYPLSREAILQLDLLDILLMRWLGSKKFKPVARPGDRAALERRATRLKDEALHKKLRPHLYP